MKQGYNNVITVSELNGAIKEILENSGAFSYLKVRGEVSNFKISSEVISYNSGSPSDPSTTKTIFTC